MQDTSKDSAENGRAIQSESYSKCQAVRGLSLWDRLRYSDSPSLIGICVTHADDKTLTDAVPSRFPFATRCDTPLPVCKPVRSLRENRLDSAPILSL